MSPNLNTSIDRLLEEHTRTIAATSPDFETATRRLGAGELDVVLPNLTRRATNSAD